MSLSTVRGHEMLRKAVARWAQFDPVELPADLDLKVFG